MGLAALRDLLDPRPCDLDALAGHHLAVDANNILWTFVTGMGARGDPPTGPHGRPISHVIGLANRVRLYASYGIRTTWVFDGKQPKLKEDTIRERARRREETGGPQLERIQIEEAKSLLEALGIPVVQAPGECDAQCAQLVAEGTASGAITQDYDAALHGCERTYRYLTATSRRGPEVIDLPGVLEREALTREQLVDMAILIGTDYNDGIHGVGPVTAVKLVREHGDLQGALEARGAEIEQADAIRSLFLEHDVERGLEPEHTYPDAGRVRALLGMHGLSNGRAESLLEACGRLPV